MGPNISWSNIGSIIGPNGQMWGHLLDQILDQVLGQVLGQMST